MTRYFLFALLIICASTVGLYSQSKYIIKEVNTEDYPNIEVLLHSEDPVVKEANAFKILEKVEEGEKYPEFNFSSRIPETTNQQKTILIIVENLNISDRQKFFKETLEKSLEEFVNPGDKVSIQTFDRIRGDDILFTSIGFTDDIDALKIATTQIKPVKDVKSNVESAHLYAAIHAALEQLKEKSDENRILLVLSTCHDLDHATNEVANCSDLAKEEGIPIYSLKFYEPGYAGHSLDGLCKNTYGLESEHRNSDLDANIQEAKRKLIDLMNTAVQRNQGMDYSFEYKTGKALTENFEIILSINGKEEVIQKQLDVEFIDKVKVYLEENPEYGIAAVALFLLIIVLIIVLVRRSKKKKIEEQRKIKEQMDEAAEKVKMTQNKISQQDAELNRIRQEKEEQELNKRRQEKDALEQKKLEEMSRLGNLPRLVYMLETDKSNFTINKPKITIGRETTNDLVLPHPTVSKVHAEIYFLNGQFIIKDLQSTNGVVVNGQRVNEYTLNAGDFINLGDFGINYYL